MLFIAWIIALGLLTYLSSLYLESKHNPNQTLNSMTDARGVKTVTLKANRAHHYVMTGQINGQEVTLFLDTGASRVALSESLAKDLNLSLGPEATIQTASGYSQAFHTTLDTLTIGDIILYDIPALVSPDLPNDDVLLGMSALKHLEIIQKDNEMILRQD